MKQNNLIKRVFIAIAMILTVSATVSADDFEVDGIYYNIISSTDKTCAVTYKGTSYSEYSNEYTGEIAIPVSVTFESTTYSVTSIGESAFKNCSSLTSVTIPNSVSSIGESTFSYCSGLASVTIPNSVTSIGNYAFLSCSGLTSVVFNAENCTTMGNSVSQVFSSCTNLTSIIIGDKVKNIPDYAFSYCSGLTSVTIPESVTSIGKYAFRGCSGLTSVVFNAENCTTMGNSGTPVFKGSTNLTSITIGDKVKNIPDYAFADCSGLTSVTIPESVTSIGSYAFYRCSGLTSVVIGNSVTSIGFSAFRGCSGLTSVTSLNPTPPTCANSTFSIESISDMTLTVPNESVSLYKSADTWKNFGNIIGDELTRIDETLVSEEGEVEYYNLQGVKVVNPSSGLYIKTQGNKVTKVIL